MRKVSSNLIYGLVDPTDQLIHYVGLSSSGLTRPRSHRQRSQKLSRQEACAPFDCARWVQQLQAVGLDYEIVVLEELAEDSALQAAERWWIAYGKGCGWPLTNQTAGGEGGRRFRRPALGITDENMRDARVVNVANLTYKAGNVEAALEYTKRLLPTDLFKWFSATVIDHRITISSDLPPRLRCPCGHDEPFFDSPSLLEAIQQMNGHIREMTRCRNDKTSQKLRWMLHLSRR
jgi:hypothetical protein